MIRRGRWPPFEAQGGSASHCVEKHGAGQGLGHQPGVHADAGKPLKHEEESRKPLTAMNGPPPSGEHGGDENVKNLPLTLTP